jgi:hypothetical protein
MQYVWVRFLPFASYLYSAPIPPFTWYKNVREKYVDEMRSLLIHMR